MKSPVAMQGRAQVLQRTSGAPNMIPYTSMPVGQTGMTVAQPHPAQQMQGRTFQRAVSPRLSEGLQRSRSPVVSSAKASNAGTLEHSASSIPGFPRATAGDPNQETEPTPTMQSMSKGYSMHLRPRQAGDVTPARPVGESTRVETSSTVQMLSRRLSWLEEDVVKQEDRMRGVLGSSPVNKDKASLETLLTNISAELTQENGARQAVEDHVARLEASLLQERMDRANILNQLQSQFNEVMNDLGVQVQTRLRDENTQLMMRAEKIDAVLKDTIRTVESRLASGSFSTNWVPLSLDISSKGDGSSSPRSDAQSSASFPSHASGTLAQIAEHRSGGNDGVAAAAADGHRAAAAACSAAVASLASNVSDAARKQGSGTVLDKLLSRLQQENDSLTKKNQELVTKQVASRPMSQLQSRPQSRPTSNLASGHISPLHPGSPGSANRGST
eukprot:CAMPEP_0197631270 /NCGR_PEP_ID=MMETSP1338-20131121/8493_1 /TAXON_ID=43686 ORGANISM="Pelagodinium beii, Strain RCC1491" /NCGR_SAMPLE_ID=MMETSP1338 /ASSEMBLY_ACC=CAM_ASM_000754 /LENGTH=443 /DNA_ID=CAMNT_0043202685 /DNA_START=38 /DNA_END=1365 /DNA_ORIENTATION=+